MDERASGAHKIAQEFAGDQGKDSQETVRVSSAERELGWVDEFRSRPHLRQKPSAYEFSFIPLTFGIFAFGHFDIPAFWNFDISAFWDFDSLA